MRRLFFLWMLLLSWQVTAQTPASVPQWQFAIIKLPGNPGEFVVAQAMERRDSGILVLSWKGERVAIEPDHIVEVVAGPVGRPIDWTPKEWGDLRSALQKLAERHPGIREQMVTQLGELSVATEQARAGLATQQWEQLQAIPYKPETPLREALRLVYKAEQLASQQGSLADDVAQWLKPWKEHIARLEAGQVYAKGGWQEKKASNTASASTPTNPSPVATVAAGERVVVNTEVENAGIMLIAMIAMGVMTLVMGLIVLAGFRAVLLRISGQSDQGILLTIPLTLIVLAILGAEVFYGYKLLGQPQTVKAWRGNQPVPAGEWRAMQKAFGPAADGGAQSGIAFSPAAANRALEEWLDWAQPEEPGMALYRTGWAVAPEEEAWLVAEEFEWMERPFVVTYRIPVAVPEEEEGRVEILANGLPLPPWIAARFWKSLQAESSRLRKELSWRFGMRKGQVVANP